MARKWIRLTAAPLALAASTWAAAQATPPPPPPQAIPPQASETTYHVYPDLRYHPLRVQIEGGYSVTSGDAATLLHDGWNVGLGLTWFPTSKLPLGLRVDGSYSSFDLTYDALARAAQAIGQPGTYYGHQNLYGGDLDLELDLPLSHHARWYFFGGAGRYRAETVVKQAQYQFGFACFYYCFPAYIPVVTLEQHSTSDWLRSWNAGMGFEFALADPASFFIEARYLRIEPYANRNEFIPIRVGLRF